MCAIHDVQEYIRYSEMGGELDFDDPWAPLWSSLRELMLKVSDEKEFSEMKVAGLSQEDFGKLLDKITKQKEGN